MYKLLEKVSSANKAGLDTLRTVVSTTLDGAGELTMLNLRTSRAVAERGAENLSALSDVRDFQGLMALRHPMAVAALELTIAYSRRAYRIYSESASTMVQTFEGQFGHVGGGFVAAVDKGRQSVAPALDFAAATAKSLVSLANPAAGDLYRLLRPMAEAGAASGNTSAKLIEQKD